MVIACWQEFVLSWITPTTNMYSFMSLSQSKSFESLFGWSHLTFSVTMVLAALRHWVPPASLLDFSWSMYATLTRSGMAVWCNADARELKTQLSTSPCMNLTAGAFSHLNLGNIVINDDRQEPTGISTNFLFPNLLHSSTNCDPNCCVTISSSKGDTVVPSSSNPLQPPFTKTLFVTPRSFPCLSFLWTNLGGWYFTLTIFRSSSFKTMGLPSLLTGIMNSSWLARSISFWVTSFPNVSITHSSETLIVSDLTSVSSLNCTFATNWLSSLL